MNVSTLRAVINLLMMLFAVLLFSFVLLLFMTSDVSIDKSVELGSYEGLYEVSMKDGGSQNGKEYTLERELYDIELFIYSLSESVFLCLYGKGGRDYVLGGDVISQGSGCDEDGNAYFFDADGIERYMLNNDMRNMNHSVSKGAINRANVIRYIYLIVMDEKGDEIGVENIPFRSVVVGKSRTFDLL